MNEERTFREAVRDRRGSETALQRELLSSVSNGFNHFINSSEWSYNQHEAPQTFKISDDDVVVSASRGALKQQQYRGMVMQVRTYTWTSDSHGLFDYESRNVVVHDFKCGCMQDSYQVCSVDNEIRLVSSNEIFKLRQNHVRVSVLAELTWSDGSYYLCPPKTQNTNLWLAVRQLRDRTVAITTGDVLKLGRFRIKVKEAALSTKDAKTRLIRDYNDDCDTEVPPTGSVHGASLETEDPELPIDPPIQSEILCNAATSHSFDEIQLNLEETEESEQEQLLSKLEKLKQQPASSNTSSIVQRICRICLCDSTNSCDSPAADCIYDTVNNDTQIQTNHNSSDVDYLHSKKFNPLVAPCDCKGSLKWVHLGCLRQWMAGRLNIQHEAISIYWRYLECELCKASYPTYVQVPSRTGFAGLPFESDNQVHHQATDAARGGSNDACVNKSSTYIELFELPRPQVPYAILAVAGPRDRRNRGFHIVRLQNQCVARLGRGHEADVRVSDISVSRLHAILKFQSFLALKRLGTSLLGSSGYFLNAATTTAVDQGCFVLEDNRSKFGTLLELKQPVRLEPNFPALAVQVYRTVVTISLKKRWRFCIPRCIRYNPPADIYVVYRSPLPTPSASSSVEAQQHRPGQNNPHGTAVRE